MHTYTSNNTSQQQPCRHCGHCPHCGSQMAPKPQYPWYSPDYYPLQPYVAPTAWPEYFFQIPYVSPYPNPIWIGDPPYNWWVPTVTYSSM